MITIDPDIKYVLTKGIKYYPAKEICSRLGIKFIRQSMKFGKIIWVGDYAKGEWFIDDVSILELALHGCSDYCNKFKRNLVSALGDKLPCPFDLGNIPFLPNGEPWYKLREIAKSLSFHLSSVHHIVGRISPSNIRWIKPENSRSAWFVNQHGIIELVLCSKSEQCFKYRQKILADLLIPLTRKEKNGRK
jgi:BRO family, N-terminal domain